MSSLTSLLKKQPDFYLTNNNNRSNNLITYNSNQKNKKFFTHQSQMSDEQILPCVVCNQQHEQMLMLVCMHDPCINCAATHYCTSQTSSSSTYICSKCGEVTDLDASSVVQLERVYAGLKAKRKYDYRRGQGSIIDVQKGSEVSVRTRKAKVQTQPQYSPSPAPYQPPYQPPTYTPISQPSYPTAPYNNIQLRKSNEPLYICQTHPQQQLSYFCFNCNCPICPECAIHGVHREHEVQTTRKAIKNIKNNLQKCSDGVVGEINNLNGVAEMYRNRLKDSSNQCKKDKDIVKESFGQLRAILMEKEKQFYKNIDTISENNTGIYRNETSVYDKLIDSHQICKKNIEQTLKKDDLAILQEYNKREKQANSSIESSKNKKYNPDLDGLKQIDYGMFRDQMEQLMGIVGAMKLTIQGRRKN